MPLPSKIQEQAQVVFCRDSRGKSRIEKADNHKKNQREIQIFGKEVDPLRAEYDGRCYLPQNEGKESDKVEIKEEILAEAEKILCLINIYSSFLYLLVEQINTIYALWPKPLFR